MACDLCFFRMKLRLVSVMVSQTVGVALRFAPPFGPIACRLRWGRGPLPGPRLVLCQQTFVGVASTAWGVVGGGIGVCPNHCGFVV